jgi:hypothetical protein
MRISKETIIYNAFSFLEKEYGFRFEFTWKTPNATYRFYKENAEFIFLELPQFGERYFYTVLNGQQNEIWILENLYQKWSKEHSGFKWWFKDTTRDRWEFIALAVKKEIEKKGTLFEVRVKDF